MLTERSTGGVVESSAGRRVVSHSKPRRVTVVIRNRFDEDGLSSTTEVRVSPTTATTRSGPSGRLCIEAPPAPPDREQHSCS